MSVEDTDRNAHATFVAVTKGVCTPDPAESALTAMKWLFGLLQKKKTPKDEDVFLSKQGKLFLCMTGSPSTSTSCTIRNDTLQR